MATVHLPSLLRSYVDGEAELAVDADTLRSALDELSSRYPALERRLRDESGALRRYVNFYVDGEECRRISGVDTSLSADAQVMILPSVAGG